MTAIQICALIALIILAGLLVWAGYIMGRTDGMSAGMKQSDDILRAESAKTIRELRASLEFIKANHAHLAQFSKRLQQALTLGNPERQTLLDIAEKLRIAADTFAAFRTGKKLERETRALREEALAMAELLTPAEITGHAKVEIVPLRIPLSTDDAEKAVVFFQQDHQAIATTAQSRGAA
ncbi:hypothetical protein ATI02_4510 [Pseudomonas baetica]|uniref:LysB family phage lysis regulatory protein n=1 Tax=Pseudomonas baetica TaxID=674054 RepID=A0ABX4Q409_9PSED|nr:hypothetical protein ATI02_4510 [Pseudomonas baetica]